ncbi:hypothetical protein BJ322DRAFT_1016694 [Thelephora terrestris]|uniref:Uncharacterized protein n=1 Tax=Thelephora terrestris TaxID=56493 RepID=A0A9P6HSY9_9AGAM|nr:hypothetical protein BJ322DRAFT_1016694 [Thelephora terrestris]
MSRPRPNVKTPEKQRTPYTRPQLQRELDSNTGEQEQRSRHRQEFRAGSPRNHSVSNAFVSQRSNTPSSPVLQPAKFNGSTWVKFFSIEKKENQLYNPVTGETISASEFMVECKPQGGNSILDDARAMAEVSLVNKLRSLELALADHPSQRKQTHPIGSRWGRNRHRHLTSVKILLPTGSHPHRHHHYQAIAICPRLENFRGVTQTTSQPLPTNLRGTPQIASCPHPANFQNTPKTPSRSHPANFQGIPPITSCPRPVNILCTPQIASCPHQ